MGFYQNVGVLVLGTRLKRLSDRFLSEITVVYKKLGIQFEPSWFPIMYLLREHDELLITEIAAELEITHSAVSQLVAVLQKKKIINTIPDQSDRRKRIVRLSEAGEEMLNSLSGVWDAMEYSLNELFESGAHLPKLLPGLAELENELEQTPLSKEILKKLNK
ncbi:MAG: MarR family winged helix-turn-helix transcriptional regulator [Calditrichia bacterium]